MQSSTLHPSFYLFFMQNCLGLFTGGFLLHLHARFNIVNLGYIIYKKTPFSIPSWVTFELL